MAKRLLTLTLVLALVMCAAAALADSKDSDTKNYYNLEDEDYPDYMEKENEANEQLVLPEENLPMIMYVYTDNGQGLNVRRSPFVGNNIIGLLPFGSEVSVLRFLDNGWACIEWNRYSQAYVQSRFLQWSKPYARPTATPRPRPTAAPTANPYSYNDTLAALNAEFRTARTATPYTATVRPSRASGWVNMRWAPSQNAEIITTYRSGDQLTVIAETQSWYQVVDPDTNATGFMMKTYMTRVY